ncbi:hypothetical protein [Pseudomonas sp. MF4836]|uniref:hypothetical protein n=1 Tax=Pseudomonas sp. MF4836 TaxID=1960827 RepID=UPI0009988183|nr:hypothetical protein [Pseudomonas sp. MF4836]OOV98708.1 hypothetical protein MF4836_07985 [Pseudomonas sp. MF4836]
MLEALDTGLDQQLASRLRGGADIEAIRAVLVQYRDKGFTAQAVYSHLQFIRLAAPEDVEDRILEAMDIASGYCSAGCRVWDVAQ